MDAAAVTGSDHSFHLWHQDAAGIVRCAHQGCTAEPTELEAAEAIAEGEARALRRIEIIWAPPG